MQGEARSAFAVIRPPGHHATPYLPMGFCLFNNAAIAVRVAQQAGASASRSSTSTCITATAPRTSSTADPSVLYTSLHQYPWYPGTGGANERGDPGASGTTVNVPVPAGTDGTRWLELFDEVVMPEVAAFDPDLIVVSAGFDAHRDDPLAELRSTTRRTRRSPTACARLPMRTARDEPCGSSKAATTFEPSPLRWRDACTCSPPDHEPARR